MSEIILCPSCERRLQLPAHFQAELVRCPSCETTFPLASALPPTTSVVAALPPAPPADLVADQQERPIEFHRSRPAVRRSSRSPCLIVALVVGAVMLVLGLGLAGLVAIVWNMHPGKATIAARVEEDEAERRELLRDAFKDGKPLAEDEIAQQVRTLFDDLAAALRAEDADRITALFDVDRMLEECRAAGATVSLRSAKDRRDFARGMRLGIGKSLVQRASIFQWNASEIRKIKKLNNTEVVLIVRHTHPKGGFLKMRWWLTRRQGNWKVYDFEDLDMASRVSTEIAALLGHNLGRTMELGRAVRALGEAIQLVVQEDLDGAEKKLAEVPPGQLPPRFEALRRLAHGMVLLHRGKYEESLKALDEAQRLQADMPVVDLFRGIALNRLGKEEQALKHLQAYRDLLGEDPNVCREIGEALREQSRFAEAAVQYRKALDFDPKESDAFLGLLRSLEVNANKDDLGPRFAKLDNLRENFVTCAEDCESREFPQLLDPLVQTMRKLDPNYPPVDYYQALVQARTGHPAEAVRSFQSALRKQPDKPQRQEYETHFLSVMAAGGHISKAYAAATDARQAFRLLAAEAVKHYRIEELKLLAAAHAGKHADDPLLPLYQAEIHVREGQYEKADRAFTEALARHPDPEVLITFRASRVRARYHVGQAMSAYRDIGPREQTFEQLAALFFQDEKDADLLKLLDAHAKQVPDSLEGVRFRYRLLIRQNKTAEGVALFQSALSKAKTEQKRSVLVSEFLWDMLAVEKLLEGYRAAPNAEEAFRQLADRLLEDDNWDELRQLLAAHRVAHAGDPWLAYYQGEVHIHEEAWDKAAKVLGEAVKRPPKDMRDRIQHNYVYALYKLGRWQQAYAEIQPHDQTFTQLANLMAADKKGAELQALLRAHRPHAGDNPALPYYEARANVLLKKWAEAVPLFQQAYRKQAIEYLRSSYQSSFLADMEDAGQWLEGYRAAVDKGQALNTLAGRLLSQKKEKELAALLEEYHKSGGGEPWYSFYLGELHLLRGQARQAIPYFVAALAKGGAMEQWRLRAGLNRARVQAGEAAIAYEEAAKANEGAFASLAFLCSQKKDLKQLQELIDAHRKVKPSDPALISWELEVLWLKQDYEGALGLLTKHGEDVFAQPQFRWKADNCRVRCLVKLQRGEEAVRVAEDIVKKHSGDQLLLVLAYAARGDVPRTIAAMGKLGKAKYFVQRCYEDADLGPLLQREQFQAYRTQFPKP